MRRPLRFSIHGSDGALLRTETIDREIIKIGKLSSCHLRIDDEHASRLHAVIEVTEAETTIIDLGTEAGTIVNGKRVNKQALRSGDRIQIGATLLVVASAEPEELELSALLALEAQAVAAPLAPAPPRRLACPRCRLALSPSGQATRLDLCPTCGGLWLGTATLRQIAELPAMAAAIRAIAEDAARRAPLGGVCGILNVGCPACAALMERRRHRRTGIVIDLCPAHGTWFDRGELTQFISGPRAGGPFRSAPVGEEPSDPLPASSEPVWMPEGDAPAEMRLPLLLQILDVFLDFGS